MSSVPERIEHRVESRPWHLLILGIGLFAPLAAIVLTLVPFNPATATQPESAGSYSRLAAVPTAPRTNPQVVTVGVHYNRVLDIDLAQSDYTLDFYIWLKWKGPIDASASLDYLNIIGEPDKQEAFYAKPEVLPDGTKYQGWHMQASFENPLDFQQYPKDQHHLRMVLEDSDSDSSLLQYRIGEVTTGPDFGNIENGWDVIAPLTGVVVNDTYNTTFGLSAENATYSQAHFDFAIGRDVAGYWTKTLLGVLIVVAIAVLVFFLSPRHVEARVLAVITALISAVLLHDANSDALPFVTYFQRVDWIYLLSYAVILIAMVETVVVVQLHDKNKIKLGQKIDRITAVAVVVLYLIGLLLTI